MKIPQAAWIFCLLILIASVPVLVSAASPSQPVSGNTLTAGETPSTLALQEIPPGNYCLECHTRGDKRLLDAADWRGSIAREEASPCPAISTIHQEMYYTERLLLAVDLSRQSLPAYMDASKIDSRLDASSQAYRRLLDEPVTSLEAFQSKAQTMRYSLSKVYNDLVQLNETAKRQRVLFFAGLVSLAVLGSLAWGLRNTRFQLAHPELRRWMKLPQWLAVGVVFVFFALPIFTVPSLVTTTTVEEQAFQTSLDTTQRAAQASGRSLARAWMLGRIGAAWQALSPDRAGQVLADSLAADAEEQKNTSALWGEALSVQEAAAGSDVFLRKAGLASGEVSASQGRAWGLRLIAEEWLPLDPVKAEQILRSALEVVRHAAPGYRDLDLRAIAVTWVQIEPDEAIRLAGQVEDPALRSWGLREIAALTGRQDVASQAVEAAHQVTDPTRRANALSQVAASMDRPELYQEAYQALDGQSGASAVYTLSEISALSGEPAQLVKLYEQSSFPDALVLALLRLGRYEESWNTTLKIADRYEQARAQSSVAAAWSQIDPQEAAAAAAQISVPVLRDRAFLAILSETGDTAYLEKIQGAYDRVFGLVALGRYSEAQDDAASLSEKYPLVDLAIAWSQTDWKAALKVVDELDQEADKARALTAIAQVSQDPTIFDQALGMAEAARVRSDSLAPAQASLNLAQTFLANPSQAGAAFEQAYQIALRISTK